MYMYMHVLPVVHLHACSDMVTQLLDSMGDDLDQKMDDCCSVIIGSGSQMDLRCVV